MISIYNVAKYFLTKINREEGESISHLKLQKLVYYAQGWYLALEGKRLFDGYFEAWSHGPVNRSLYREYRDFGWELLPYPDYFSSADIPENIHLFLNEIWDAYGRYTATYLEELVRQEEPWCEARGIVPAGAFCSTQMNEIIMMKYYRSLIEHEQESAS